jgi:hypothetical protein
MYSSIITYFVTIKLSEKMDLKILLLLFQSPVIINYRLIQLHTPLILAPRCQRPLQPAIFFYRVLLPITESVKLLSYLLLLSDNIQLLGSVSPRCKFLLSCFMQAQTDTAAEAPLNPLTSDFLARRVHLLLITTHL